jgi:hypothetical protein
MGSDMECRVLLVVARCRLMLDCHDDGGMKSIVRKSVKLNPTD